MSVSTSGHRTWERGGSPKRKLFTDAHMLALIRSIDRQWKNAYGSLHSAMRNQVWSVDLAYLWTDEGWLYLAVVHDLFKWKVVGWSIKPHMTADIVMDALTMAWFRRQPAPGLMYHSDRGSQ